MPLQGRVALVTGASRGIGKAIAAALADAGADLIVTGTSSQSADAAAAALQPSGRKIVPFPIDLAELTAVEQLMSFANRAFGRIDVLVNNAGTVLRAPVLETTEEDFRRVLQVNLNAPFGLIRAVLPGMLQRKFGRIINISSISATMGTPRLSAYCASKWGLNGLTKAVARELDGTNVLCAGVMPGSVDTDMLKGSGFEPKLQPEEVAQVVRFLCGHAPMAMQGSLLEVFG